MEKVVVPKNYSTFVGFSSTIAIGNLFTQNLSISLGDGQLLSIDHGLNYGIGSSKKEIYNAGTHYITIDVINTNVRNARFLSLDITNLPKFLNRSNTSSAGMVYVILRLKLQDNTYIELYKETIAPGSTSINTYGSSINKKYYINLLTRQVGTTDSVFNNDHNKAVVPKNWMYHDTTMYGFAYNNLNASVNISDEDKAKIISNGYLGICKTYIWDAPPVNPNEPVGINASAVQLNITFNPDEFRFLKLDLTNVPMLRHDVNSSTGINSQFKNVSLRLNITNSLTGISNIITLKSFTIVVPDNFNSNATSSIWADGIYDIDLVNREIIKDYKAITSL